ncbi:MAG: hypothetical protein KAY32_15180 [Candidatus Eisenbacteria sp.]|nr:hypothetical protein [Candidatus Eisenbacteria bacterium]
MASMRMFSGNHVVPVRLVIPLLLALAGAGVLSPLTPSDALAEDGLMSREPAWIREIPILPPEALGPEVPAPHGAGPMAPPVDPQVGDSWLWWLHIHYPMPPHFEQHMCTVRGKSDRGYVVIEDSQWEVNIFQEDVDLILERWENTTIGPYPEMGIYEIDSLSFGDPPDALDGDPRIYLLWYDFEIAADGFFFWFDQYPDGTQPGYRSNECEVLYLNSNASHAPSSDYMLSVVAHEFEHLIHWKYDANEDTWVDEGLAELAMWFYGRPDEISNFNAHPDNRLTKWDGTWADYIKTYLWTLYFFERYGGHETIYAVVHEAANSIAGYEAVLDDFGYTEDCADVFADWAVANYLDDPTIGDGRFGYLGDDLPDFQAAGAYSSYPAASGYKTVQHWATDYYRLTQMDAFDCLEISFDGSDDSVFAIWGLALYADGGTDVLRMPLEGASQTGTLRICGLADPADEVVLVVCGVADAGTQIYSFTADAADPAAIADLSPGQEDPGETGAAGRLTQLRIEAAPNPSRSNVVLRLFGDEGLSATEPRAELYDAQGRLVRILSGAVTDGQDSAGPVMVWDGRRADGRLVAPGVYYLMAKVGPVSGRQKILRLP